VADELDVEGFLRALNLDPQPVIGQPEVRQIGPLLVVLTHQEALGLVLPADAELVEQHGVAGFQARPEVASGVAGRDRLDGHSVASASSPPNTVARPGQSLIGTPSGRPSLASASPIRFSQPFATPVGS